MLAQGISRQSPLSVGAATIALSALVLMAWIPLRQAPGLGTVLNAILVGVALDVAVGAAPVPAGVVRPLYVLAGIGLVVAGSGLYLTCRLGPGPRDGLMTGLSRRTGRSLRVVRMGIELAALALGAALGGTVGVGTVAFALLIGPGVQFAIGLLGPRSASDL